MTIELERDENDAQNISYHQKLFDAWNTLLGHAIFEGILKENPPSIKDGGACAPFEEAAFDIAIAGPLGCYTCAINLAWVNFSWSATPGTPMRESVVELVKETTFAVPTALSEIVVAVPENSTRSQNGRGRSCVSARRS